MIPRHPLGPLVGLIAIVGTSVKAEPSPPKVTVTPANEVCRLITGDLLKDARRQIERGDIVCAREILLAPEAAKSAPMVFLLAETYDPDVLAAWQIRDAANIERAKALYEKARDFGRPEAQSRLDRLRAWP